MVGSIVGLFLYGRYSVRSAAKNKHVILRDKNILGLKKFLRAGKISNFLTDRSSLLGVAGRRERFVFFSSKSLDAGPERSNVAGLERV